jgi:hypothetical protein
MKRVMLTPGRVGPLRRSVRDAKGKITNTLVFEAKTPLQLKRLELEAVQRDLRRGTLVEVELDHKDRPRVVGNAAEDDGTQAPNPEPRDPSPESQTPSPQPPTPSPEPPDPSPKK